MFSKVLNFGCDPEVFAVNKNGEVISPALLEIYSGMKFIRQDKMGKHPVYIDEKNYHWLMDGVAFELGMKKPFQDVKEFYSTIHDAVDHLQNFVSKISFEGEELQVKISPVVDINPERYISLLDNEKVFQGFIFGCDPDEDAIRPDYVCETLNVETHKFRYGGGHIHVSGSDFLVKYPLPAIKYLAIAVGNFCIKNSPFPEEEKQRATTYGRPGRYRRQRYPDGTRGLEYRTPSNSWLGLNFEQFENLFEHVKFAVDLLENEREEIIREYLDQTVTAITNCDQVLAENILNEVYNVG